MTNIFLHRPSQPNDKILERLRNTVKYFIRSIKYALWCVLSESNSICATCSILVSVDDLDVDKMSTFNIKVICSIFSSTYQVEANEKIPKKCSEINSYYTECTEYIVSIYSMHNGMLAADFAIEQMAGIFQFTSLKY